MGKGIKADAKKAKGKKETEERKAGEKRMQENPVMHEVRTVAPFCHLIFAAAMKTGEEGVAERGIRTFRAVK